MAKPTKTILPSRAKKYLNNWKANRGQAIDNAGFEDTFETWFSLKDLKDYIEYVEQNSPAGAELGIRIYYASYPNDATEVIEEKRGTSTVFLAPTLKETKEDGSEADSNNYDLDPMNTGNGGNPPIVYDPDGE